MPGLRLPSPLRSTSICFLLGLLLCLVRPDAAPAQFLVPPCQIELETAFDAYVNQEYGVAIDLASGCTAREGVSQTEVIAACRLMSLSYFRQQALVDARRTITHILSIDPTYEADPVEALSSYALLVSMVRDVLAVDTDSTRLARIVLSSDSSSVRLPPARLETADDLSVRSPSPPPPTTLPEPASPSLPPTRRSCWAPLAFDSPFETRDTNAFAVST